EAMPYDGRADVYSLGVTLYEMLSGRVPFQSEAMGLFGLVRMHLQREPERLREIDAGIPEAVEAVVMKALEKDPEKRPTARELGAEFLTASGIEPEMLSLKQNGDADISLSEGDDAVFGNTADAEEETELIAEGRRHMGKILNSLFEREPDE